MENLPTYVWCSDELNIQKEIQKSTREGKVVKSFPEAPLNKKNQPWFGYELWIKKEWEKGQRNDHPHKDPGEWN